MQFCVQDERYREHNSNKYDTPPKWKQDWDVPQDHDSGNDLDDEGEEVPNGPQFDQEYLSWWDGMILDPL